MPPSRSSALALPAGVRRGLWSAPVSPGWTLPALAGQLVELSGHRVPATLTAATALVLDAQQRGELVAWVTPEESSFFPPDLAAWGIDLEALLVVRLADPSRVPAATARLARAGAFGLLVLDLGARARLAPPDQARLAGCATRHGAVVLCLTRKPDRAPSLGALVGSRYRARAARVAPGRFEVSLEALKDKRRGPGWRHRFELRGPDGLG